MDLEKVYYNQNGEECNILQMVKCEPEWAANRIQIGEKIVDSLKSRVYTPEHISKGIIDFLNPTGICLDPCKGDGAFFKYLPEGSEYCELQEQKDFFHYHKKVEWVIGNPPYSIFEEFLEKSFLIANNVSFLVPTNKIFQRQIIMEMINNYGGLKSIIIYGSGQLINFSFGFSVGNFHFKKGYKGECKIVMGIKAATAHNRSNGAIDRS